MFPTLTERPSCRHWACQRRWQVGLGQCWHGGDRVAESGQSAYCTDLKGALGDHLHQELRRVTERDDSARTESNYRGHLSEDGR